MLKDLELLGVYKSDQNNILEDFYFPALSNSTRYDRAVGFFSASTISYAAQALSTFVKNDGNIRLILGAFCEAEDFAAVKEGYKQRDIIDKIGSDLLSVIYGVDDELFKNRFETLAWLVAHGKLDVKIAMRKQGMYHDKIGVITDETKNSLVFAGSANESTHALLPGYNYESITVFKSWVPEHREFYEPHMESFERLWLDQSADTIVLDIPEAVRDNLVSVGRALDYVPDPSIELAIATRLTNKSPDQKATTTAEPKVPTTLNGRPFDIREHQKQALDNWKAKGDFQGVLELATGAGKTITAIYAIVRLHQSIKGLTCVIAVPYQNLADQWADVLNDFNIFPIRCYISRDRWADKLRETVHDLRLGARKFVAIVVVNRTLKSDEFQESLNRIDGDKLFWIGDECHHHTSKSFDGYLPIHARFRLGLSATPEHYLDDERNERLNDYYGDIVYHYPLSQAVKEGVLTPYLYYPHLIELSSEEADEFIDLSDEIGTAMAREGAKGTDGSQYLTKLLTRRARLIGAAENKLPKLRSVLMHEGHSQHTLFYCGDGSVGAEARDEEDVDIGERQIEAVSKLLHDMAWSVSRFTSRETRGQREDILENFRLGIIDAMVAIRCLDEGIDVPACSKAFILASSRDPRQFIQRRGRILRRSPGKDTAIIHDFVVILPEGHEEQSQHAKRLIKSELHRVAEFSSLSKNRSHSYEALRATLVKYGLEHLV